MGPERLRKIRLYFVLGLALVFQACGWTARLFPAATEVCGDGIDDDADGQIDEGCPCDAPETQRCFTGAHIERGVGVCIDGLQQCQASGEAGAGLWSSCLLQGLPSNETCEGALDEDCDGAIDEGCPCEVSFERSCGRADLAAPCASGAQSCGDDGFYTSCLGASLPEAERCFDLVDNDCDGIVNEGCGCIPAPESCGDAVDNDCDGAVDESSCQGIHDCSAATPGWSAISSLDALDVSYFSSAVWTGNEAILWKGPEGTAAAMGRIFAPRANAWRFMTNGGAPTVSAERVALWTGTEMLIWGDESLPGTERPSALYHPDSDSWRPMAQGSLNLAAGFAWVWTGSELLVWGIGEDSRQPIGAIYTLLSDTWRPMATDSGPSARQIPVAVWTGREMLIWGGILGDDHLGDGHLYNPDTDTWRPMALNAAMPWREMPASAWTGSELLIWGGRYWQGGLELAENSGFFDTGFLYSPETNLWRASSNEGAIDARSEPVVATSDESMFVWAGRLNFLLPFTPERLRGGVYDFATDTWSPITEVDAPMGSAFGLSFRASLWTGCSLLVFGQGVDIGGIWSPER